MQSLNNDMDELFRRAAENYPLNTEGANWDKIMQQLPVEKQMASKADRRHYLWLLLLLPLSFICNKYVGKEKPAHQIVIIQNINNPKQNIHQKEHEPPTSFQKESDKTENDHLLTGETNNWLKQNSQSILFTKTDRLLASHQNQINSMKNAVDENQSVTDTKVWNEVSEETSRNQLQNNWPANSDVSSQKNKEVVAKKEVKTTPSLPDTCSQVIPNKKKQTVANRERRLYAGLVLAPDISGVKTTKVQGAGYSFGVVVGYQINKKLDVESGVLWDKKQYYSDGQYFNTDKMELPAHTTIINANGNCYMIEVPLNVRYHFAQEAQHHWLAAAGISSYLMKKEDYNYLYERYGAKYYAYKDYKNSSKNWFSVMNLAVGYEKKLGKVGTLRIQPYLKVPLKGVGIGRLPLSSAGVELGITKPIR